VALEVAVISVWADNDFDHPCDDVLERLQGRVLYRTDQHGTIDLVTDGARLWVNTERAASPWLRALARPAIPRRSVGRTRTALNERTLPSSSLRASVACERSNLHLG
jgi:hypothetical protein